MFTGDDKPGNVNTHEIDLNNGGWIIIGILIFIVVALLVILIVQMLRHSSKDNKAHNQTTTNTNNEEAELLSNYRVLSDCDKKIIQKTMKTLTENDEPKKE